MVNIISEKMKPYVILVSLIVLFFISMNNKFHKDRTLELQTTPVYNPIYTGNEGQSGSNCIEYPSDVVNNCTEGTRYFSGYPSCKRLIGITIM